ncbi:nitric oxide reductase transcriptional regulator NorR [Oceanisphaera arctica]|uniref:Nitric oxide reductase transcription regulator n=1 Tax=Oceanisphaera arctica TaxID=641510 RepID=A0A2P5TNR9_9GAMM|nr:nitric oxide reductase transcriptional regulator NorR [Oceanisphaera arctica]PPL17258.1 nitric oxide reductase transcription regulator [Oceanisphaera arctica]GHA20191.1 anaerobic nitric oxide reductase transcriptional regulator [Oceanisphaera arctica]
MIYEILLADLTTDLPSAVRLQSLVRTLRESFHAGAVCLLRLDDDVLSPVAVDGLVREALGRRFVVAQHPRLAAILASRSTVAFAPNSTLPDPYDGLLEHHVGEALPVHDCMGISLYVEGNLWGALTLDALEAGTFDREAHAQLQRLMLPVAAAVRMTRLEQDIRGLRLVRQDAPELLSERREGEILGQSGQLRQLLQELDVVADSELPVLLTGETGVGKDLFAHRLHQHSRRRRKPLVQVNCAALPESLAESELFGHVKGAFSGAGNARPGRFEAADGGTLFLDEVGELPLGIQAKLLRTLQNGEIQRLGEDKPRKVNVRVIAATNRQLHDSVRDGHFRADLYHRLSVYPVPIPPLRERGGDVLVLAGHFLELNRARLGVRSLRLSPASEQALCRYDWPGNVRELEHVISRAAIKALSRGAVREDIITLEPELLDLAGDSQGSVATATEAGINTGATPDSADLVSGPPPVSLQQATNDAQRRAIEQALMQSKNNWAAAARLLEIDPSNLHKLAKRLGMK